jgi:midasin (ATPase involved in ribosome maturation)
MSPPAVPLASLNAALYVLTPPSQPQPSPSTAAVAAALSKVSHIAPLAAYEALSYLREGQAREVLQRLLRASAVDNSGNADAIAAAAAAAEAAVRVVLVLRREPETRLACELLAKSNLPTESWSLRARSMLAFIAGSGARDVLVWTETLAAAASSAQAPCDNAGSDELRLASTCIMGIGNAAGFPFSPSVISWDEQHVLHSSANAVPSVWTEIACADYTRQCMFGQSIPRAPQALSAATAASTSYDSVFADDDPEYVIVQGIRLRRRRSLGLSASETALGYDSAEKETRDAKADVDASSTGEQHDFVQTDAVVATAREMAMALADGESILLEGLSGCGKSDIVADLARRTAPVRNFTSRNDQGDAVIRVQMDSISGSSGDDEFSALVGAVVPLPAGGGFRWRAGPIGVAVERGYWLVLENISSGTQSATVSSIVSQLASLQPGDKLEATGRGSPISVAPGFAVIATRTTSPQEHANPTASDWEPPGRWSSWRRVTMPPLTDEDLQAILQARFPIVADCTSRVLTCVAEVKGVLSATTGRIPLTARSPNMRDAVKLCRRLESLRTHYPEDFLTPESAVMEALDVLCNWEQSTKVHDSLLVAISSAWSISPETTRSLSSSHVPSLSVRHEKVLEIGRASLHRLDGSAKDTSRSGRLALTGHTLRLMEQVGRAVQLGESVLLSGESGSGKTACIQDLATRLGKTLVVVNMSRSSDIGDLLGGFRPVDADTSVPKLARAFEEAFCMTMSREKNERFLQALRSASRLLSQHCRALKLMRGALNAVPKSIRSSNWSDVTADLVRLEERMLRSNNVDVHATSYTTRTSTDTDTVDEECRVAARPVKKRRTLPASSNQCDVGDFNDEEDTTIALTSAVDTETQAGNNTKSSLEFEYVDGVLVTAMRKGHWILLDEINLAPAEVLERLAGLMEDKQLPLSNAGADVVSCMEGFTLFAAMNPPTDVGKRPLPFALRSRFTELFVSDCLNHRDLAAMTLKRLFGVDDDHDRGRGQEERKVAFDVADFYLRCRELATAGHLADGAGKKIRYSLRSLARMLDFAAALSRHMISEAHGNRRALFEGAQMAFVTPLPREARDEVASLAYEILIGRNAAASSAVGNRKCSGPHGQIVDDLCVAMNPPKRVSCVQVAGFHLECSGKNAKLPHKDLGPNGSSNIGPERFVITSTVRDTLKDVCRALVAGAPRLPVLLQGPTAAGKTSLVAHLADITGKKLVRINNHEHTDVAEYLGSYVSTADGALQFYEGPVIQAARSGDWIVLDELNLAPPEVLEALNRLLDDNREIRIPETGEVVKAAKSFTIFATQNPPGLYGGRKDLSRAFRGRFVEVQVDDMPDVDLKEILVRRSCVPSSFADRMVATMRELQVRRRTSQIFSGKAGFVTARDLFRWAARMPRTREDLAKEGFFLLGERSRIPHEREVVRRVLEKHMGVDGVVLSDANLYSLGVDSGMLSQRGSDASDDRKRNFFARIRAVAETYGIALTPAMRRMLTLLGHCVLHLEPALLVGDTGVGKTTACKIVSQALRISLATVNCHRHTEASDFVGSYRPGARRADGVPSGGLFEWVDGPLVTAMKEGQSLLVDEINMADDAVSERLNSVLETERALLLAEKGSVALSNENDGVVNQISCRTSEIVVAVPEFQVFATMNPGGDFGKKELSPALRNRFTEIWIPMTSSEVEYAPVVSTRILAGLDNACGDDFRARLLRAGEAIVRFVGWNLSLTEPKILKNGEATEQATASLVNGRVYHITLRDTSAWADFVREVSCRRGLDPMLAFAHGARLVLLDGLTVGSTCSRASRLGDMMWTKILQSVPADLRQQASAACFTDLGLPALSPIAAENVSRPVLQYGPFSISRSISASQASLDVTSSPLEKGFSFGSRATASNCARIARAMAMEWRPILLEGPPGAGKSSIVEAIASVATALFTRINLSEHTELSDLIGGFVPSTEPGAFLFRRGPLLAAMQQGHWVLLDELNLASQSVLEGLNAILDHRRSVFVSELGLEVHAVGEFRVFAAQNAAHQGGGRRGLPRSFLNRFTRVNVEAPSDSDIAYIASATHPTINPSTVRDIVSTLRGVSVALAALGVHGHDVDGSNLRDALRWCDLLDGIGDGDVATTVLASGASSTEHSIPDTFFDAIVLQRLVSTESKKVASEAFRVVFGHFPTVDDSPEVRVSDDGMFVRVGRVMLSRASQVSIGHALPCPSLGNARLKSLEALALAVSSRWPAIVASGCVGRSDAVEACDIVKTLAALCGRRLVVMNFGSSTDCADLLGGYAQRDVSREISSAVVQATEALNVTVASILQDISRWSDFDMSALVRLLETHRISILALESCIEKGNGGFVRGMENLFSEIDRGLSVIGTDVGRETIFSDIFQVACVHVIASKAAMTRARLLSRSSAGAFEWRKSALVEAAESGDWVIIPDADMCPAAVLDRLNPLLERPALQLSSDADRAAFKKSSGCLLLAEAPPNEDGSPVVMYPHSDFRVFMTVDTRRGGLEGKGISKALRNRSLEVFLGNAQCESDKVYDAVCCGAPGNTAHVLLALSDAIAARTRLSTALREGAFLRATSASRSLYAYGMNDESLSTTIVQGSRRVYGISATSSICDSDAEQPQDLFVAADDSVSIPVLGMVTSLRRLTLGSLASMAGRDLTIMRMAMMCLEDSSSSAALQWCRARNCLISSHPLLSKVTFDDYALSARTLYFTAEACIMASVSAQDLAMRRQLIASDLRSQHSQRGAAVLELILSSLLALEGTMLPAVLNDIGDGNTTISQLEPFRTRICAPLDPVYGLDSRGMSAMERVLTADQIALLRRRAVLFRFQVTCFAPLFREWNVAMSDGSSIEESLPNAAASNVSLFTRSKVYYDTGVAPSNASQCCFSTVEHLLYPLLKTTVDCAHVLSDLIMSENSSGATDTLTGSLDASLIAEDGAWTVRSEALWQTLFSSATRICAFSVSCADRTENELARLAVHIRILLGSVPLAVREKAAFKPLDAILTVVAQAFKQHLMYMDYRWTARQGLPAPHTAAGIEIEGRIAQLLDRFSGRYLGLGERNSLIQALVSVSSRVIEAKHPVLATISRVPRVIEENLACSQPEKDALRDHVGSHSLWSSVTESCLLEMMISAMAWWSIASSDSSWLRSAKLRQHEALKVLKRVVQEGVCSETIAVSRIVPFQRMVWLAEAGCGAKSTSSGDAQECWEIEVLTTHREGMIALLAHSSGRRRDALVSERTPAMATDGPQTRSLAQTGSEMTSDALRMLFGALRKDHLWSSSDAVAGTTCSAVILVGGSVSRNYLQSSMLSSMRIILLLSFIRLVENVVPGFVILSSADIDKLVNGDATASSSVVRIVRQCFGDWKDDHKLVIQPIMDSVLAAFEDSVSSSHQASLEDFHRSCALYGRAWAELGATRLSLVASRLENGSTLDPAMMADADAGIVLDAALTEVARSRAYQSVALSRLGGLARSESGPMQFADGVAASFMSEHATSQLGISFRPSDKAPFGVLLDVVTRLSTWSTAQQVSVMALTDRLSSAVEVVMPDDDLDLVFAEEDVFQESCSSTARRLEFGGDLSHLRDVSGEVSLALREMQYGVFCCASAARRKQLFSKDSNQTILTLSKDLLAFPRAAVGDVRSASGLLSLYETIGPNTNLLLTVMQLLASHQDVLGLAAADGLDMAFSKLVDLWKTNIEKAEEDCERKNSLFRIRIAIQHFSTQEDDEASEKDFADTFNSVDSAVDGLILGDLPCGGDLNCRTDDSGVGSTSMVSVEDKMHGGVTRVGENVKHVASVDASVVWPIFERTIGRTGHAAPSDGNLARDRAAVLVDIVSTCAAICTSCNDTDVILPPHMDQTSPAAALAASIAMCRMQGVMEPGWVNNDGEATSASTRCYNFYTHPNTQEAMRGAAALSKLARAATNVQETYFKDIGDQPVLAGVAIAAERASRVGTATPLGVLVVGFENVLRKADEWQRHFATKAMKMVDEVRHVAEIAARWRSIEVASWPRLIESRVESAAVKGSKWFYYLYDAIFASDVFEMSPSPDLSATLDQFLRSSPSGEFEIRLRMLTAFANHIAFLAEKIDKDVPPTAHLLRGLTSFYEQFKLDVEASITAVRTPLEARMREFASLAKWDKETDLGVAVKMDSNRARDLEYYRLKAAAGRTHRKLHKVCREMDAALQVPVSGIIAAARNCVGLSDVTSASAVATSDGKEKSKSNSRVACAKDVERALFEYSFYSQNGSRAVNSSAPAIMSCSNVVFGGRLSRLPNLCSRVERVIASSDAARSRFSKIGSSIACRLQEILRKRVASLRSAPSVGVQAKRKAFVDLLRCLKTLGISPYVTTVPEARRDPIFWLSTPNLVAASDGLALDSSRAAFFSAAKNLGRLRDASAGSNLSSDLSRKEAVQCMAYCAHMFDMAAEQRHSLSSAIALVNAASKVALDVSCASLSGGVCCQTRDAKCRVTLEHAVTLEDARCRLKSIAVDLQLAASHAAQVSNSAQSTMRREISGDSVQRMSRKVHMNQSLPILPQVTSILRRAAACAMANADKAASFTALTVKRVRNPCFVLTEATTLASVATHDALVNVHAEMVALAAESNELQCPGNLASVVLRPVVDFCDNAIKSFEHSQCPAPSSVTAPEVSLDNLLDSVKHHAEVCVSAVLIGTQQTAYRDASVSVGPNGAVEDETANDDQLLSPKAWTKAHGDVITFAQRSNIVNVLNGVSKLARLVSGTYQTADRDAIVVIARATGSFVTHYLKVVIVPVLSEHVHYHLQSLHLLRCLESLFVGLCEEGFCRPPDEELSNETDENVKTHDGTGFGDVGDGDASFAKDVSHEVQEEEQLLGLKDDIVENKGEQDRNRDHDDQETSGMEMSTDFDGALEDVPKPSIDESNTAEEDEEGHQPEKRMGDDSIADEGVEIVDERLWDDDQDMSDDLQRSSNVERGEEIEGDGVGQEANLVARDVKDDAHDDADDDDRPTNSKKKSEKDRTGDAGNEEDGGKERDDVDDQSDILDGTSLEKDEDDPANDNDEGNKPKMKVEQGTGVGDSDVEFDGADDMEDVKGNGVETNSSSAHDNDEKFSNGEDVEDGEDGEDGEDEDSNDNMKGDAMGNDGGNKQSGVEAENGTDADDDVERATDHDAVHALPDDMTLDKDEPSDNSGDDAYEDGLADPLDGDASSPPGLDSSEGVNCMQSSRRDEEAITGSNDNVDDVRKDDAEYQDPSRERNWVPRNTVDIDGGLAMTNDTGNPDSAAAGLDTVMGSRGGDAKSSVASAHYDAVENGATKEGGAAKSADADQIGAAGFDSTQKFAAGKSTDASAIEDRSLNANQDPNPHRVLSDLALVDRWDRQLNMLAKDPDAMDPCPSTGDIDVAVDDGLFEFVDGADGKKEEDAGNNGMSALGPATEDQHRGLPSQVHEEESADDDDDDGADCSYFQSKDGTKQAKDNLMSEFSKRSSATDVTTPIVDPLDGVPGEEIAKEKDECVEEENAVPGNSVVAEALDVLEALGKQSTRALHLGPIVGSDDPMQGSEDEVDEESDANNNTMNSRDEVLSPLRISDLVDMDESRAVNFWKRLDLLTSANAASLCEQLRLVLEPTLATGLAGDFRTGKRLNMRRVIEFVASDFHRDRIWLRRVRPEKRSYDVLIAIDDSESMADSGAGPLALEALSLLTSSLALLEVGRVAVATFGAETELIRGFDEPLPMSDQAGGRLLSSFSFAQQRTDVTKLLDFILEQMAGPAATRDVDSDEVKLAFVVSDGRLSEREEIRRRVRQLLTSHVLVAFIVVDIVADNRKSIFDVQRVEYEASAPGKVSVTPYMDKFPVDFYSVVRDVAALPLTLADALRQWFEIVSST